MPKWKSFLQNWYYLASALLASGSLLTYLGIQYSKPHSPTTGPTKANNTVSLDKTHNPNDRTELHDKVERHKARTPSNQVGVLILQEGESQFGALEAALVNALSKRGLQPVQGHFKGSLSQDGRGRALFSGQWDQANELHLVDYFSYLILGLTNVSFKQNGQLEGVWTANLQVELKCLDVVTQRICGMQGVTAQGADFNKNTALENAVTRASPQVE